MHVRSWPLDAGRTLALGVILCRAEAPSEGQYVAFIQWNATGPAV